MKYFRKDAPYYYPLPKKTVYDLFTSVFTPFTRGASSTLITKKGFGGGKAMTKFMVNCVNELSNATDLPVSTKTHRYIYVDPDLVTEATSESYMDLLFESYAKVFKEVSRPQHVGDLIDLLDEAIKKMEVVFILRGINYVEYADTYLWGNIGSLWRPLNKVHFLFVLYEGGPIPLSDARFDRIRSMLSQNMVRFDTLSEEDIEYSIDRWSYTLEYEFSGREREEIIRVSCGCPSLLKVCSFAAAKHADPSGRSFEYDPSVQEAFRRVSKKSDVSMGNAVSYLSPKELGVYRLLEKNSDKVVTKDGIAGVMWPKNTEEHYSEAAIVRLIGRIRQKCDKAGSYVRIRAVYGRGYVLEEVGSDSANTSY